MKYTIIIFLTFFTLACSKSTTVFLVRHAEKADNSRDPDLSETGKARAAMLADILKNEKIKTIYSTAYKRTQQTGAPLSQMQNISVVIYKSDSLNLFAKKILNERTNSLIIGHSNTTITMLNALGLSPTVKTIEDSDYNNLFKVIIKGKTKKLEELKF